MKRNVLFVAMLLSCASSLAATSQQIGEMPFPIAGGQILHLPATDAGPLPAENDKIKILVAGFVIGRSASGPKTAALTWRFGFQTKTDQKIEQVTVEEVGASDTAKLMLSVDNPTLEKGVWSGGPPAIDVNKQSAPWIYSSKPSIFVFKFSIKMEGMPTQILYQPSWFPAVAKKAMMAGYE